VSLSKDELRTLAELGAFNCFANHRRSALWKVEGPIHDDLASERSTSSSPLVAMTVQERVTADYRTMNLTAGPHPMKLLREKLPNIWRASDLAKAKHGAT